MISFTIPTYNSSKTLAAAIASIKDQVLENGREIIVVDGGSVDNTVEIAESHGAKVIRDSGKLLSARRLGLDQARGETIVLLDSDQVLRAGSIKAACDLLRTGSDMVVLGERVYQPRTLMQRLSDRDKELLAHDIASQLDPLTGVMLPRVFRRNLLAGAFEHIPRSLDAMVVAHDHAIIYFETYNISSRVGYVPDAVWHVEPDRIWSWWRKNYRYGWSTRQLLKTGHYTALIGRKTRTRDIHARSALSLRLASLAFIGMKAIPYAVGYALGSRVTFGARVRERPTPGSSARRGD